MALIKLRRAENISGDFYVDSSCIDCDLCRQIAPATFREAGNQSAVWQQPITAEAEFAALKALVTCPTASIGTVSHLNAKAAVSAFPEEIEENIYFCGFASPSSYGASSYLITRAAGNIMIDSPRFARPLAARISALGGIKTIFLTHSDDVADYQQWAAHFQAEVIIHEHDAATARAATTLVRGLSTFALSDDLLIIPTPGHTRGHAVLLYHGQQGQRVRALFSGDHLWGSERKQALESTENYCWYSWPEQIRSMERLLDYDFEWVLPGHGRRVHAPATVLRQQLIACIERAKK